MANNFDEFPLYEPIVPRGTDTLSPVWQSFLSTHNQNLNDYLSQSGVKLPKLTQSQINSIQSPELGQIVFNSDSGKAQVYEKDGWKTFSTS